MAENCREVQEWVEEEVVTSVEEWVERREEKCEKRKCKKLCLCCNKWFCWIEVIVEKVVTTVVTTVVKLVTTVVCEVAAVLIDVVNLVGSFILGIVSGLLSLVFMIPFLGTLLRWIYEVILAVVWRLASIPDVVLGILGLFPPKLLHVRVLVACPEGVDVTDRLARADAWVKSVQQIFLDRANVRVVPPSQPFRMKAGDDGAFVHQVPCGDAIVQPCGAGAFWDDLGFGPVPWYEQTLLMENMGQYLDSTRRILKYGAPLFVFMIDDVKGPGGCSLGPLADYVVVGLDSEGLTVAHELGHACGLWHVKGHDNLMRSTHSDSKLKKWQKIMLRASEHVTYF
jgi:hypothetical protein